MQLPSPCKIQCKECELSLGQDFPFLVSDYNYARISDWKVNTK